MLIRCFDTDGKEHLKEGVDARECVEHLGWTMETVVPRRAIPFVGFEKAGKVVSVRVGNTSDPMQPGFEVIEK